jgi:uncharacterized protein YbjT (DUF2867 family)
MEGDVIILVTGATGNIGKEIVKLLSSDGLQVRALVRDTTKAVSIQNPNVEVFEADVTRPETLGPALRGIDRAFMLTPLHPNQVEHQAGIIEAARRAGTKHVVKLSTIGAGLDSPVSFARWHAQTEKQLAESGLNYTILRPHFFMQNILMFAPGIAADRTFYAPLGEGRIAMVDVRDIAAVAVAVLTTGGHAGKTHEVTGPEALSFSDVADKIGKVTSHRITYTDVTPAAARSAMLAQGMPDWLAQGLLELYDVLRAGHGAHVTNAVPDLTGREARTFDQFAREHAFTFGA